MTQVNNADGDGGRISFYQHTLKTTQKTTAQKASDALLTYFASGFNATGIRAGMTLQQRASAQVNSKFQALDNSESGTEKGNGSLTAKTWNNLMKQLGVAGHNIQYKISLAEVQALVKRLTAQ